MIEDSQLEELYCTVSDLFSNSNRRQHLEKNLKSLDQPEEAFLLADNLEELISAKIQDQSPAGLRSKQV